MIERALTGLLGLHVAAGVVAVLAGLVAILTEKGGPRHVRAGQVYVGTMAFVVASAFPLAVVDGNAFLFTIAIFTGYLLFAGYRVLDRKRGVPEEVEPLDWLGVAAMLTAGAGMVAWGGYNSLTGAPGIYPALVAFGTIGIVLAGQQAHRFRRPTGPRMGWFYQHIAFMGGAYIATITASATVNLTMLPPLARWLGPTAVGVPAIVLTIRRSRRRFEGSGSGPGAGTTADP